METLQDNKTTSESEQNWAAMAQLLGLLVALPAWLIWRKRSGFVRLHAVQSMLFDIVFLVLVGLLLGVLVIGVTTAVALIEQQDTELVMLLLTMFAMPICSLVGILGVATAVLLLRIRASAAALQGKEFFYPLLKWKAKGK